MTRRELREHCFKLLFCAGFLPGGGDKGADMSSILQSQGRTISPLTGVYELIHCPSWTFTTAAM